MNAFEKKILRRLNIVAFSTAIFTALLLAYIVFSAVVGFQQAKREDEEGRQQSVEIACRVTGDC